MKTIVTMLVLLLAVAPIADDDPIIVCETDSGGTTICIEL